MTQAERILDFIASNGAITQRDAYQMGIYRLASRINDLRNDGVDIETERKRVRNADGTFSTIAVYKRA